MDDHRTIKLAGRSLRRAALASLLRAARPMHIADVLTSIEARGFTVGGDDPRKSLSDALGYEHKRGWARRVSRGVYAVGTISESSRWRLLNKPHNRPYNPSGSSTGNSHWRNERQWN